MISAEIIQACEKDHLSELLSRLEPPDLHQLVEWLSEKDDNFRYKCFLLVQSRSQAFADVYPFWDVFVEKLNSANSYQRSIGLMLIAENVRWDQAGKFEAIADRYLSLCDDEKPVTVRQCIQSLGKIVPYKKDCYSKIIEKLISIDLAERKETQRKLLLLDILGVLGEIRKVEPDERIERYFHHAMTGGLLDEKTKRLLMAK